MIESWVVLGPGTRQIINTVENLLQGMGIVNQEIAHFSLTRNPVSKSSWIHHW